MKTALSAIAILFFIGGTFFGVLNWFLSTYYLESVDWEGPMVGFNDFTWLLSTLGFGIGGTTLGIAVMIKPPSKPRHDAI